MESKTFIRLGVIGALIVICSLCGLTAYGTISRIGGNVSLWDVWDGWSLRAQSAEVDENRTYEARPVLEIATDAGDIRVTAAAVDEIEVELVRTSYGDTVEEAEAGAEALVVRATESGDTLLLEYRKPDDLGFGLRGAADTVDFIVRVPAETSVDLHASFGEIAVSGLEGDAVLETDFGDVDVEDVTGALKAESSNASITARRIDAGEAAIDLNTSFGDITLEDANADAITVVSSNGAIAVLSVGAAGTIRIENQFGSIEVVDIAAAVLVIEDQNGPIRVEGGELGEEVSAVNRFGDVTVTGVAAPAYRLSSSNGDVTVEDASGILELETSFGDIIVLDATNASLDLQGSNGAIEFTGTLAPTEHTIRNTFGDVTLTIPGDSAFSVVLKTEFGDIRSDIPLALTGTLESRQESDRWEAEMNGGGPLLEATTSNGDVAIQVLNAPTDS